MNNMYDIIVIGGGPAGLTAAIYARRSGKTVLVLEKESFGGQIATSPKVENFPTIKSISGAELIERLMDQVESLGAEIDIDEITHIEKVEGVFKLHGEYSDYEALSVIIANGCKHRQLKANNIEKFIDNGVSYCAVCDGAFYEGKDVCLVGDANTALQYALMLSNICNHLYVCTLFDRFFGEETLINALVNRANVTIYHNVKLMDVLGDEKIESLVFENTLDKNQLKLDVEGLFVAIGQIPNNQNFQNVVDLDDDGYFNVGEDCMTKTEGLFVAGDCRKKGLRQVTTAVSDASIATTNALNYLFKLKGAK